MMILNLDKGVTVVVLDIFSAISKGDLECFHSLLKGIRLSPFHAEMCVAKSLIDGGNNTDIMSCSLLQAFLKK